MRFSALVTLSLVSISLALRRVPRNRVQGTSNSAAEEGVRASAEKLDRYRVLCNEEDTAAKLDKRRKKHNYDADIRAATLATRGRVVGSMLGILLTNSQVRHHIITDNSVYASELEMTMIYCSCLWVFAYQLFGTWCSSVLLMSNAPVRDGGPCSTTRIQAYILHSQVLQRILNAISNQF